jgi:hypothetical protein
MFSNYGAFLLCKAHAPRSGAHTDGSRAHTNSNGAHTDRSGVHLLRCGGGAIDVSGLREGIYNLSIATTAGVVNKRVVIVR